MDESMIVLSAVAIGALAGGTLAWLVRNEIGRRRLLDIEDRWKKIQRRTERQRDELEGKLGSSDHQVAKAERDLLDQARKSEDSMRLVHDKEMHIRKLESALEEGKATQQSQKAVIALMKSQIQQSAAASPPPPTDDSAGSDAPSATNNGDDLKLIRGIGPAFEKKLHDLGVTSFRQIAKWQAPRVREIAAQLGIPPQRIERDDWVVGAKYRMMAKQGFEA